MAGLLAAPPATASPSLSQQKSSAASQLAAVQAQLRSSLTSDAQVEALANRARAALGAQQARVENAQFAQAAATEAVSAADRHLADLAARTATEHARLVQTAVDAYMNPSSANGGGLVQTLSLKSMNELALRQAYLSAANVGVQNIIDAYHRDQAATQDARVALEARRQAAAAVTHAELAQESRLADTAAAQAAAATGLAARIADLRHESTDLGAQQAHITSLIQAQEQADAARAAAAEADSGRSSGSAVSRGALRSPAGLRWPLSGVVTSEYGPRWGGFHPGIDIAAGYGTPIGAAKAGVVIYAGYDGGYGNYVCVDHGGGISTCYAHQSQIAVSQGQAVSQGETIGYEGSTGDSTGPHVHFEVRINGATVNPRDYVPGDP